MRRRKLFTLAAGLSAILCAAACGLWVRSYWATDQLRLDWPGGGHAHVFPVGGVLEIGGWPARAGGGASWRFHYAPKPRNAGEGTLDYQRGLVQSSTGRPPGRFAGFEHHHFSAPQGWHEWIVPMWAVALPAGVMPAAWLARRRRVRHRQAEGLCLACGYDLRATPERCPECGAIPAAGAAR